MLTMDELLSSENVQEALASFHRKRDGCGPDGMHVSELDSWWQANGDRFIQSLKNGTYRPGIAVIREVVTHSGKRREMQAAAFRLHG